MIADRETILNDLADKLDQAYKVWTINGNVYVVDAATTSRPVQYLSRVPLVDWIRQQAKED